MQQAYDGSGTIIASQVVVTTGQPAAVNLSVEVGADGIFADGQDVALLTASIVDASGRVVPTASNRITFSTSGPGTIIGTMHAQVVLILQVSATATRAVTSLTKRPFDLPSTVLHASSSKPVISPVLLS